MTSAAKSQPQNLSEAFGVSPTYDLSRRATRPKPKAEPASEKQPAETTTQASEVSAQEVKSDQRRPSGKAASGSRSRTPGGRASTQVRTDDAEPPAQSARGGGAKPIVVYLTEEAHDRARRWREENRLTFGQMILIAVDRTAASGQLEAEFSTGFDTDGPTTGLFDFGPLPTKHTSSDAKRDRTMSVTMTQSNLEALNRLAESLPGHPSRSFMISTALDLFLDSRR